MFSKMFMFSNAFVYISLLAIASCDVFDEKYVARVTRVVDESLAVFRHGTQDKVKPEHLELKLHYYRTMGTVLIPITVKIDKWNLMPLNDVKRSGGVLVENLYGWIIVNTNLAIALEFEALANVRPLGMQEWVNLNGTIPVDVQIGLQYVPDEELLTIRSLVADVGDLSKTQATGAHFGPELTTDVVDELSAVGPRQMKLPLTLAIHSILKDSIESWTSFKVVMKDGPGALVG